MIVSSLLSSIEELEFNLCLEGSFGGSLVGSRAKGKSNIRAVPRKGNHISKGTEAGKYREQQQETSTARRVRVGGEHC